MVGADGQPQWPYDTRPWQGDSPYSRGERGEDVVGGPLWSPVRAHHISSPYLNGIGPCGRPSGVLFEMYWPLRPPGLILGLGLRYDFHFGQLRLWPMLAPASHTSVHMQAVPQ